MSEQTRIRGRHGVFRMAASSLLPDEVAFRKKVGFPVPVRKWLADAKYNRQVEEKLFGECFETHDQVEGMTAFIEKRKEKNFTGK